MTEKPTHRLQATPLMRAQDMAEYMVASDIAKRSVIRRCKYRPLARVVQHREARSSISAWLREGTDDTKLLSAEADRIRNKLSDSDFDDEVNEHNAGYIEAFREVCGDLAIPACDMQAPLQKMELTFSGLRVRYSPDLLLRNVNSRNVAKSGALFLLYSKGKNAKEEEANYLNAFSFGYLSGSDVQGDLGEAERKLCISVCAYSGQIFSAPGNAVTRFKNMQAAGATIADIWGAISPPPKAILDS